MNAFSMDIKFPDEFEVTPDFINNCQLQNSGIQFSGTRKHILQLVFSEEEIPRYIELTHPLFDEKLYEKISKINERKFEYYNNSIILKMGTFGIISAITMAISAALFFWAKSKNSGRVYTEDGEYELDDPKNPGKKIRRRPDASFISYDKVSEKEQKKYSKTFINKAPTLAIEIVSNKRSLNQTLKKMKEIWMENGTDIGIVVCPFTKKLYIFEGKENYREQSIFEKFTHPLLSGYEGDYSEYVNEIE